MPENPPPENLNEDLASSVGARHLKTLFNEGKLSYEVEDYASALATFQKVRDLDPLFDHINYEIGFCHLELGTPEKASFAFSQEVHLLEERTIVRGRATLIGSLLPTDYNHDKVYLWNCLQAAIDYSFLVRDQHALVAATTRLKAVAGHKLEALFLRGRLHLRHHRYSLARGVLSKCIASTSIEASHFRRDSISCLTSLVKTSLLSDDSMDKNSDKIATPFEIQFKLLKGSVMMSLGECQLRLGQYTHAALNVEAALGIFMASSVSGTTVHFQDDLSDLGHSPNSFGNENDANIENKPPGNSFDLLTVEPCRRGIFSSFVGSAAVLTRLYQLQAECQYCARELPQALVSIDKALETRLDLYHSHEIAFKVYMYLGRTEDMIACLRKMVEFQSVHDTQLYALGPVPGASSPFGQSPKKISKEIAQKKFPRGRRRGTFREIPGNSGLGVRPTGRRRRREQRQSQSHIFPPPIPTKKSGEISSEDNVQDNKNGLAHLLSSKNWLRLITFYSHLLYTVGANAEVFFYRANAFRAIKKFGLSAKDLRAMHCTDPTFLVNHLAGTGGGDIRFTELGYIHERTAICFQPRLFQFIALYDPRSSVLGIRLGRSNSGKLDGNDSGNNSDNLDGNDSRSNSGSATGNPFTKARVGPSSSIHPRAHYTKVI